MDKRNLLTTLAILALITVAATAAGCTTNTTSSPTATPIPATQTVSGNNTTISSAAGFNITFPKTLLNDTSSDPTEPVRVYIYLAQNNTIDAVNVGTGDILSNATLNDWKNYNIDLINDYPNYQLISSNNTTFAGKPANNVVWQATVPVQLNTSAASVQNMTLKVTQTFLINNSTGYVVTYKAIPSDYNTYLEQAQRIMNTFTLI